MGLMAGLRGMGKGKDPGAVLSQTAPHRACGRNACSVLASDFAQDAKRLKQRHQGNGDAGRQQGAADEESEVSKPFSACTPTETPSGEHLVRPLGEDQRRDVAVVFRCVLGTADPADHIPDPGFQRFVLGVHHPGLHPFVVERSPSPALCTAQGFWRGRRPLPGLRGSRLTAPDRPSIGWGASIGVSLPAEPERWKPVGDCALVAMRTLQRMPAGPFRWCIWSGSSPISGSPSCEKPVASGPAGMICPIGPGYARSLIGTGPFHPDGCPCSA